MRYRIEYACISDRGRVRAVNQDNFYCCGETLPRAGERTEGVIKGRKEGNTGVLFGVFDGMGGEQCGEDASYIAASTVSELRMTDGEAALRRFCTEANRRIVAFTEENKLGTCGSTVAMLSFADKKILLCNVGDSRIYQLKKGKLLQLS